MRGDFYEKTICFFLDLSERRRVSNLKPEDSGKVLSVAYLKPGRMQGCSSYMWMGHGRSAKLLINLG